MKPTQRCLVDSNVLLDVFTDDPQWFDWSGKALEMAAREMQLCINPLIYAEVSVGFNRIEELDAALPVHDFIRLPLPLEAAFLAGKAFLAYRRRHGSKTSPLPDFYIGAHAAVLGMPLLTRDAARFRSYFPSVQLIAPSS